jgi:heme exporter protein D
LGLIIPFICFVAATILAFRPLFIIGNSGAEGLIGASVMVWLTFNIPTLAFMIPFVNGIKTRKTNKLLQEAAMNAAQDEQTVEETTE